MWWKCNLVLCFMKAGSDVCKAGLQMRADRCGRRHVGLRGKSFRTTMLKYEGKSIDVNCMGESKRQKKMIGKMVGKNEKQGVTLCL